MAKANLMVAKLETLSNKSDMTGPEQFRARFLEWRQHAGLTQDDLAKTIGTTKGTVSRIETNKRGWGEDYLSKFARAVGVEPGALFKTPSEYEEQKMANGPQDWTSVQDAIRAFANGEIVVVTDDNDRENEGDLFVAASKCTPEKMAFVIRHTSGIVCAPMTAETADRLNLAPMVSQNNAPLATAFTVSVDVKHGMTTGISADERNNTVRTLANGNAGPSDFVKPGHVFPLIARDGGVLMRSGHTEACVDMCRLANLPEVGVLSELVNDDGTVKRGDQVAAFAAEHDLKLVSIADLIGYRQARERLVERLDSFVTHTNAGEANAIAYSTPFDDAQHLALVVGDIGDGHNVLVRLHREDVLSDVFAGGASVKAAMDKIASEGRGVLVYLRDGRAGVPAMPLQPELTDGGAPATEDTESARTRSEEWREIGLGAQILKDLGVSSIRLLASKSRHYVGLSGFGIAIAETIPVDS